MTRTNYHKKIFTPSLPRGRLQTYRQPGSVRVPVRNRPSPAVPLKWVRGGGPVCMGKPPTLTFAILISARPAESKQQNPCTRLGLGQMPSAYL
jgi:hypothetical protein